MGLVKLTGVPIAPLGEGTSVFSDMLSNMQTFLTSALTMMGNILTWCVSEPLVMFFVAIGLAGVMFRWAKAMLHI